MFLLLLSYTEEEQLTFFTIYEKYNKLMFYVTDMILNDAGLAEDAVQDTCIKIIKNLHLIDAADSDKCKRLIITITKHTAVDLYRKRKKLSVRVLSTDEITAPLTEFEYPESDDSPIVRIMAKMKEPERDIFLLKYVYGYQNKHIASLLGLTEANIRQKLRRGKVRLEKMLAEEGILL